MPLGTLGNNAVFPIISTIILPNICLLFTLCFVTSPWPHPAIFFVKRSVHFLYPLVILQSYLIGKGCFFAVLTLAFACLIGNVQYLNWWVQRNPVAFNSPTLACGPLCWLLLQRIRFFSLKFIAERKFAPMNYISPKLLRYAWLGNHILNKIWYTNQNRPKLFIWLTDTVLRLVAWLVTVISCGHSYKTYPQRFDGQWVTWHFKK